MDKKAEWKIYSPQRCERCRHYTPPGPMHLIQVNGRARAGCTVKPGMHNLKSFPFHDTSCESFEPTDVANLNANVHAGATVTKISPDVWMLTNAVNLKV